MDWTAASLLKMSSSLVSPEVFIGLLIALIWMSLIFLPLLSFDHKHDAVSSSSQNQL